jgi:hypothetical protein
MEIHFTIGWAWVETFCHVMAAFLYMMTGYSMGTSSNDSGIFTLIGAIALTAYGASL